MIGLFFGNGSYDTNFGNEYGNIELDAVLSESHEWSAEATTNPVEEGSPIVDHVIEQPDKLIIRGFVSNSPITLSASFAKIFEAGGTEPKTQTVFALLHAIIKAKEVVTVYTKHRIYMDMALTNVSIPRDAGQGEGLEFTAEFLHIRKVSTQVVDVPNGISAKKTAKSDAATGRKAEPQKDGGPKQPQTITRPSSTLSRLFN